MRVILSVSRLLKTSRSVNACSRGTLASLCANVYPNRVVAFPYTGVNCRRLSTTGNTFEALKADGDVASAFELLFDAAPELVCNRLRFYKLVSSATMRRALSQIIEWLSSKNQVLLQGGISDQTLEECARCIYCLACTNMLKQEILFPWLHATLVLLDSMQPSNVSKMTGNFYNGIVAWLLLAACESGAYKVLGKDWQLVTTLREKLTLKTDIGGRCSVAMAFYHALTFGKSDVDYSLYTMAFERASLDEPSLLPCDLYYAKLTIGLIFADDCKDPRLVRTLGNATGDKLSALASRFASTVILPCDVREEPWETCIDNVENVEVTPFYVGPLCMQFSRMDSREIMLNDDVLGKLFGDANIGLLPYFEWRSSFLRSCGYSTLDRRHV